MCRDLNEGNKPGKCVKRYFRQWEQPAHKPWDGIMLTVSITNREASTAGVEAARRRVVGEESREPERSIAGKVWPTPATALD